MIDTYCMRDNFIAQCISYLGLPQNALCKGVAELHCMDPRAVTGVGWILMSYPTSSPTFPLWRTSGAVSSSSCTYWYGLWILHRICRRTFWRPDPSSHVWWTATNAAHCCGKRHPSSLWPPPWLPGTKGRWLYEGHRVQPQLSNTAKQPALSNFTVLGGNRYFYCSFQAPHSS